MCMRLCLTYEGVSVSVGACVCVCVFVSECLHVYFMSTSTHPLENSNNLVKITEPQSHICSRKHLHILY